MYESIIPPLEPHIGHRMFSHRVLISTIAILLLAISSYLFFLYWSETSSEKFTFKVEQTDTIHSIARRLMEEGIIKHRAFFYFSYYVFGRRVPIEAGGYELDSDMRVRDMIYTLESKPLSKSITIKSGMSKEKIGEIMADALGWDALDRQFFSHTYAGMQWQQYQELIEDYFQKKYSWNNDKTHTFLTLSALYYDNSYDFLKNMYIPGTYEIPLGASRAQAAGILIDRFVDENPNSSAVLEKFIDRTLAQNVVRLIDEQMVLMPDIVAIPPRDMTLKNIGGRTYLLFTASYWNKGRGPLELIADPKTKGVRGDVERNVLQRIYQLDGNYTERLSGKFLWHSPHLHYHFQDFAIYTLESLDRNDLPNTEKRSQKSTFCVRDSEPIDLSHPGATKSASYTICGKERQGISPGWADSYYYTYVDQKFDVTDMPKGSYLLKIIINPLDRFEEMTKDNNIGEVKFDLDVKNKKVKVISEKNYGI
ncbi:MAG: endolytic transglycosylase MltG [Candidatus Taylorbacteria bacterium]|nr:endolytic transglycosylase MltG [Candidatus Taylorbacteria bacterium]